MTEFFAAQARDPFDHAPMLIQADWLEEHGDATGAAVLRALVGAGIPSVVALSLAASNAAAAGRSDRFGPRRPSEYDVRMGWASDPTSAGVGVGDSFEIDLHPRNAAQPRGDGGADGSFGRIPDASGLGPEEGCGVGSGEAFCDDGRGKGSGENHLRLGGVDDGVGDGLVEDGRIRIHSPYRAIRDPIRDLLS